MSPTVFQRAIRAAAVAAAGAALLAACSTTYPQGRAPSHPITKARTLHSTPEAVRSFADPASCGEYQLGQGERLPRSAMRCIRKAGDHATSLVFSTPTTEGDPIVTFVSHRPGQRSLVLWTTSAFDRYGTPGWERVTCDATALRRRGFCIT